MHSAMRGELKREIGIQAKACLRSRDDQFDGGRGKLALRHQGLGVSPGGDSGFGSRAAVETGSFVESLASGVLLVLSVPSVCGGANESSLKSSLRSSRLK